MVDVVVGGVVVVVGFETDLMTDWLLFRRFDRSMMMPNQRPATVRGLKGM